MKTIFITQNQIIKSADSVVQTRDNLPHTITSTNQLNGQSLIPNELFNSNQQMEFTRSNNVGAQKSENQFNSAANNSQSFNSIQGMKSPHSSSVEHQSINNQLMNASANVASFDLEQAIQSSSAALQSNEISQQMQSPQSNVELQSFDNQFMNSFVTPQDIQNSQFIEFNQPENQNSHIENSISQVTNADVVSSGDVEVKFNKSAGHFKFK